MTARWLAGKVAAALLTFAFVLVFNFFLFRVMGDPTTQLARLPQATPKEIQTLRHDYGLDKPLTGQFADYVGDTARLDLGHQPAQPPAGLGRDQGRASVDAAARGHRDRAGNHHRQLDGGGRRDAARQEDRRRPPRLQPVHLRRAGVLDRDHPDPRLRRLDTDLPRRPADDARGGPSPSWFAQCADVARPPGPAGHGDDPDAAGSVLPDHALVDGGRPHRGLHHGQAGDRPAMAPGGAPATPSRTRCCRW